LLKSLKYITTRYKNMEGNKRTALASALVFLELNGIAITDPEGKLYDAMLSLASGKITKSEFTHILKSLRN